MKTVLKAFLQIIFLYILLGPTLSVLVSANGNMRNLAILSFMAYGVILSVVVGRWLDKVFEK